MRMCYKAMKQTEKLWVRVLKDKKQERDLDIINVFARRGELCRYVLYILHANCASAAKCDSDLGAPQRGQIWMESHVHWSPECTGKMCWAVSQRGSHHPEDLHCKSQLNTKNKCALTF